MSDSGSIRDLDYVIWEVRLTVLLQLVHWKLRANNVWTVLPEPAPEERLARAFARMKSYGVQT